MVLGVKLTNLLLGVSHVRKDGCPGAIRPRAYISRSNSPLTSLYLDEPN